MTRDHPADRTLPRVRSAAPSTIAALSALPEYFTLAAFDPGCRGTELAPIFALRYQTYCLERGFLPQENYPDGLERDRFDPRSAHFAARDSKGELAGTARLVLAADGDDFPFRRHCPPFDHFDPPPIDQVAEVSRLAVSRFYRRRAGDTWHGINRSDGVPPRPPRDEVPTGRERRTNAPLLVLGLYRAMYRYSREAGIRYWYAAMEKSLVRILARFDFVFVPIGPESDYYGPVTPYLADLHELESRLAASKPDLLDWFQNGP